MIVVVPVDPPRDGLVLSSLLEETPLTATEATRLYEAAAGDVFRAVAASGGDLLVNYRDAETLPSSALEDADGENGERDPAAEVRAVAADALGGTDDVRFEPQVGSSRAARIGNTVTHLLEREDATSVGVLEPTAPLVERTQIDGAAMSLRRNEVVLGPAIEGRTYFAGFAEPIDFAGATETPELATLARRGADAGHGVGFAPMRPTLSSPAGLRSTVAELEARRATGRRIPERTASVLEDLGLAVADGDRGTTLERR